MEGSYKLVPMIYQARCFVETRQNRIARQICGEIVSMIEVIDDGDEMKKVCDVVDSALRDLAEEFVEELHDCETALILARARFMVIKTAYEGLNRIIKLERIGLLMQNIAEELAMQSKRARFKPQYKCMGLLMEEILEEMQNVTGIGVEVKCTRIAWYLKYVGFCCDEVGDFQKSLLIYQQAITVLKTVFGDECRFYRVLGHCYNNMAFVLESTNHLTEATSALRRAIDVFDSAVDWNSEDEKAKCISKTSAALHEIKAKLALS